MFPLGSVVFPFSAVPLRVFEPRYLTLLDTVSAGDSEFGTVLIERGFEVGGGDVRFDVGTRVRIVGRADLPEGHQAIVITGVERIRILEWLEDDPHPWAMIEPWDDTGGRFELSGLVDEAARRLETAVALASELGADTGHVDLEVSDDPIAASYQLAALSPVTPLDSHELLAAESVEARLASTIEVLDDRIELIRAQLASGT